MTNDQLIIDINRLRMTLAGARVANELIRDRGFVVGGLLLEGFLEGVRIAVASKVSDRAAYEMLQRQADRASAPILNGEASR